MATIAQQISTDKLRTTALVSPTRRWEFAGIALFGVGLLAAAAAAIVWLISKVEHWRVDVTSILLVVSILVLFAACHCYDTFERDKRQG